MKTYLRMLKMVRPYMAQAIAAIVFTILFSFTSVFSFTMISPFLKALFLDSDQNSELAVILETTPEATIVIPDSLSTDEAELDKRDRLDDLQSKLSMATAAKTWFMNWMNDTMLEGTKQDALLRICLVLLVLVTFKNVACYGTEVFMVYVSENVMRCLRNDLFMKFARLPLSYYHQNKAGELISRATNDVLIAQKCIGASFTTLVRDPFLIVTNLAIALILSWKLTLMALVLLPASLVIIIRIGKGLRSISHKQQEEMANLTVTLQETVYGVRVIKAFAMEDFENRKFVGQSQMLFGHIFRYNRIMKMSSPLTELLSILVGSFLLWYGGSKVFTGGIMSPDLFIVFLAVVFSMVRPIKNLGQVNNEIQAGIAAAERIFSVLDADPEVSDPTIGFHLEKADGRVEFDNVEFEYVTGEPVLRGVSIEVKPGEVVALVGSSGSGKSTMMDMIPGFYQPGSGEIRIDGHNLQDLNLASLRRNMGMVTQEVILFHDTIFNNIAYGLDNVSLESVRAAAVAANADEFIDNLPAGYQTIIGDRGLKLSGGQRQRISIARAILKNPPILLLDEATSALDTEAEQLVQEAIDHLVKHRTTIVIAHRLSTIQNVDRIYLLERGQVVQVGTHQELLAEGGRYKELYTMQFNRK